MKLICFFQKATIGRGRGYTSRNRDKKPGNLNISDETMQSIVSANTAVLSNVPLKSPSGSSLSLQSPPANNVSQPFGASAVINKKFSPPMTLNISKISHPNSQLPQVGFNQTAMGASNKQLQNSASNNIAYQNFDDAENLDENIQSVLYIDEKYTYLIQQVLCYFYFYKLILLLFFNYYLCMHSRSMYCQVTMMAY